MAKTTESTPEFLNLLLLASQKVVGEENVLINPYGSLGYANPLYLDEFPLSRVSDFEVGVLCDAKAKNLERLETKIMEEFKHYLEERGHKTERTELGMRITFPDGDKKSLTLGVTCFDELKKIPLPKALVTGPIYGSKEAILKLVEKIKHKFVKEKIVESLSTHYFFLFHDAKTLSTKGNPKFYKRVVEMFKYIGVRPEILEEILKKYELWKNYLNKEKTDVMALKKLKNEWYAVSIDCLDNVDELIGENLTKDENSIYRLKIG